MTARPTLPFQQPGSSSAKKPLAVLLTCYMSGATEGHNLGTAGYSYDFVAQLFASIFEKRAHVIPVPNPEDNLDQAAEQAREAGYNPLHISFLPFQDVCLCNSAPNIVVPAWEFPDVPNEPFNQDQRNDWIAMANRCELVIVGGPFTVDSMHRGGTTSPVRVVPVPTPNSYFETAEWQPEQTATVDCGVYWPKASEATAVSQTPSKSVRRFYLRQAKKLFSQSLRSLNKSLLGPERYSRVSDYFRERRMARRERCVRAQYESRKQKAPERFELDYSKSEKLELSGVVYSSIFNPDDGRKNWHDLLTSFLYAVGDKPDATLIIKLITRRPESARRIIDYYLKRDIPHRCKVGFVTEYLSEDQMQQLAAASTFYLQTTKAEGNCLPLMNALAAGRPGISPCHSAISDYFDEQVGFVIESNPEPAVWPHDPQLRFRTTWGRVVWPSAKQQIEDSYDMATKHPEAYQLMASQARDRMSNWASFTEVERRVHNLLDEFERSGKFEHVTEQPTAIQLSKGIAKAA